VPAKARHACHVNSYEYIRITKFSYFHTVLLGYVVSLPHIGEDRGVTTQIWGKDFSGVMETTAFEKSSFFAVRPLTHDRFNRQAA
jgi:hypothetical protein